ncbi:alpha/beta hydrolase [Chitinophaga horti]|uniref:Alpha/beta hydrolase n=1 Tax=Chitinophaga horti TaxID=2920382 RepID=A0ABY6J1H6_9BACT|nr:alpha/beta hydrolase [Chitinophaga horti]UYQ92482.1 alpha/beta hydrolase [Chitinophaga horti]
MSSFFIPYGHSKFHAVTYGNGPELLICLHGFGENAAHFECLQSSLGDQFTLLALNMPFHGETVWQEQRTFEKEDLINIFQKILQHQGKQKFSLLGYSMGGRLALCIIERMAGQINHLVLIAPDGLKNNPWHMFVTQTRWGNRIFKHTTYHPAFFFRLLTLTNRLGMINQSVYKFAFHSMDKLEKRELVYTVWTALRRMMPSRKRCKVLLAKHHIPTLMMFGKYDRVIPPVLGYRFSDGTFPCKIIVLNKGHQLLSETLGAIIKNNISTE